MAARKGLCKCRMPYAECVCDDDDESEWGGKTVEEPITDEQIEQEIRDKGLTSPRITREHIDSRIGGVDYHVFPGTTVAVCCIVLDNGYAVTGQSAAASRANFDEELGQKIAYADVYGKIWALEGYLLRERLSSRASR